MYAASVTQTLDVWDDLVRAYFGVNKFDRDVAEVYYSRLETLDPRQSVRDLIELCVHFQRQWACRIEINGVLVQHFQLSPGSPCCHVRVIPNGKA